MTGLGKSEGCCIPSSRQTVPSFSKCEQTPKVQPQRLHNLTRATEGTGSAGSSALGIGDGNTKQVSMDSTAWWETSR